MLCLQDKRQEERQPPPPSYITFTQLLAVLFFLCGNFIVLALCSIPAMFCAQKVSCIYTRCKIYSKILAIMATIFQRLALVLKTQLPKLSSSWMTHIHTNANTPHSGAPNELAEEILKGKEAFGVCAVLQHSGHSVAHHHDAGCHHHNCSACHCFALILSVRAPSSVCELRRAHAHYYFWGGARFATFGCLHSHKLRRTLRQCCKLARTT